jgi:hypothetical protein
VRRRGRANRGRLHFRDSRSVPRLDMISDDVLVEIRVGLDSPAASDGGDAQTAGMLPRRVPLAGYRGNLLSVGAGETGHGEDDD